MFIRATGLRLAGLPILIWMWSWAQANDADITLEPDADTFFEKYDKTVDVAGQLRAGLMYKSAKGEVDIEDLKMDLSLYEVSQNEKACIRVASRNGAFSATWEVTLDTEIDEQVITNFPTRHQAVLEDFKVDQLAAIASVVGADEKCAVSGRYYLPTSWGSPDRQEIVAYLNADSTDVLIAGKTSGDPLKETCRILPATDENTAFDTICKLDLTSLADNVERKSQVPSQLVVLRKNFTTVMKNISYPLSSEQ